MELRGRRIAVTGATGFIGRYIVRALLARGVRVVGVVRNPDKGRDLSGVELRRADLCRREELTPALDGCDAVVSNAALIALGDVAPAEVLRTNVEGTRNVFEAMGEARVSRAVLVSTVSVYARRRRDVPDEGHPLHAIGRRINRINAYAISKVRAEEEARRICEGSGIGLTIVRPNGVYGASDNNGFTRWFQRLVALPVAPYPIGMSLSLVYAADVAEAIALCLERPASIGRVYNLAGEHLTAWNFLRAWKAAGGRVPRLLLPIPLPLRQCFDSRRARDELGWRPRPFADGIADLLRMQAEMS